MKIVHRISLNVGEKEQTAFAAVGVDIEVGFTTFQIKENDERWTAVAELIRAFQAVDVVTTKFSERELNSADFLGMVPTWHHGYPEPSGDFGYLEKTFDLSNYCKACGIGKAQIAPFRIKRLPVWGNKSVLQLNWVFDEFFVRPDVWNDVFKPFGIGCRPVFLNRNDEVVDSIVQLDVSSTVELAIESDRENDTCPSCGKKKYMPITRGFYPAPIEPVNYSMFKSSQYVGSGGSASHLVTVSASLYRAIRAAHLKGVDFKACTQ